MAKHDELLEQGPREAPEPETAEQRSKRLGVGAAGGAVAAAGAVVAKLAGFKAFLWVAGWFVARGLWTAGLWVALGVFLAAILLAVALNARREG